ncbi:MAG TPA: STAS domain-containing protein, partial [Polyangiales bacterium]|nr:STAS domain-containing protein [Polyangiales bacterium]
MSSPSAETVATSDAVARVALQGELDLRSGKTLWNTLKQAKQDHTRQVDVDLTEVTAADGSAAAILTSYRAELRSKGVDCQLLGARENVAEILRLYENAQKIGPRPRRKAQGQLDQIGTAAIAVALEAQMVIAFFGQMVVGVMNAIRAPRTVNWKELMPTAERAGADAVPIVALINFLVGMVISLQSAAQLHRFGADIYMADLVG